MKPVISALVISVLIVITKRSHHIFILIHLYPREHISLQIKGNFLFKKLRNIQKKMQTSIVILKECKRAVDAFLDGNNNQAPLNDDQMDVKYTLKLHLTEKISL